MPCYSVSWELSPTRVQGVPRLTRLHNRCPRLAFVACPPAELLSGEEGPTRAKAPVLKLSWYTDWPQCPTPPAPGRSGLQDRGLQTLSQPPQRVCKEEKDVHDFGCSERER